MKSRINDVKEAIENPELTKSIVRWCSSLVRPFWGSILIILLINAVSTAISYGSTIIGKYVVDDATSGAIDVKNMSIMIGCSVAAILIRIISQILSSYINERFAFGVRIKMFANIQRSMWQSISQFHSGDIVTRLTSDISTLTNGLITTLPNAIIVACQFLLSFFILFYYDKSIAFFALGIAPLGAVVGLLFRKKYKQYQRDLRENESSYRSFIQDAITNITVMKTFQQEDVNNQIIDNFRQNRLKSTFKSSRLSALMAALMNLIYRIGYVVAFCWGAYRISTGAITYGTLTIFISLVSQVQSSVSSLAGIVPELYSMLIASKRIYEIAELPKETSQGIKDLPTSVGVKFNNVSFRYDPDKEEILHNLTMNIKPGQRVGIVGESGAGKTTLIRLLMALTVPTSGSLNYYLSDDDSKSTIEEEASPDSRRFISYVPQGNTMLSGSIADNLRIGNINATEEQMWQALSIAGAEKFMKKLPEGLDTILTEKSGGISEGQAQRISIARAIISSKPVLIMDEATSALDEKTESLILKNISEYCSGMTCFIITHRRSMLQFCDSVIEFTEDGQIVLKNTINE